MQDTILETPPEEEEAATTPPPPEEDGARFSVPITIELESTTIPLAELQAMRGGAVLPLDTEAGSIRVRLLASGKPFAHGTLISVGDGYGVLIEAA